MAADADITFTRSGRSTTRRLLDYLTPDAAEDADRLANEWIKSLRLVAFDGLPFREAFSYRGDSLWWFAEIFLHKQRTINDALAVRRAFDRLIDTEAPESIEIATRDRVVQTVTGAVGRQRGIRVISGEPATGPSWPGRLSSVLAPAVYAFTPLFRRFRNILDAPVARIAARVDVVVFVHSAFWRNETGEDTYVGPLVDALKSSFGERLAIVSLGPRTTHRVRTWAQRFAELWGRPASVTVSDGPTPIEAFSSVRSLAGSRGVWSARAKIAGQLLRNQGLRQAAIVEGLDLWPVLERDLLGIATLQAPWSARAMDEAAAALDALRPRVIVTYAEAGGWGRALVLEARRRGIASVGLQHGFISRHWLNYLHEPDEMRASQSTRVEAGYPFPTLTLLYDEFAREHLIQSGHFPDEALRVVGNPRLDELARSAAQLTKDDLDRARAAAGAQPSQHLVLLAVKYRRQWHPTLAELVRVVAAMPDVFLAIRPHPGDAPDAYAGLVAGVPNVRVVSRAVAAVALIKASRVVSTINSTVAIEAMALGVLAFTLRQPSYLTPFVTAGVMAGASSAEQIGATFERLVRDDGFRQVFLQRSQDFMTRHAMTAGGKTAERTVAAVRELVERTVPSTAVPKVS